jgi:hypothetical protein
LVLRCMRAARSARSRSTSTSMLAGGHLAVEGLDDGGRAGQARPHESCRVEIDFEGGARRGDGRRNAGMTHWWRSPSRSGFGQGRRCWASTGKFARRCCPARFPGAARMALTTSVGLQVLDQQAAVATDYYRGDIGMLGGAHILDMPPSCVLRASA